MKKADVEIGVTYAAKVSGRICPVRIDGPCHIGSGWYATNLFTGRQVRILSAQRLRFEVEEIEGKPGSYAKVNARQGDKT